MKSNVARRGARSYIPNSDLAICKNLWPSTDGTRIRKRLQLLLLLELFRSPIHGYTRSAKVLRVGIPIKYTISAIDRILHKEIPSNIIPDMDKSVILHQDISQTLITSIALKVHNDLASKAYTMGIQGHKPRIARAGTSRDTHDGIIYIVGVEVYELRDCGLSNVRTEGPDVLHPELRIQASWHWTAGQDISLLASTYRSGNESSSLVKGSPSISSGISESTSSIHARSSV